MFLKKTMILAAAIGLAMSLASAGCGGGGADENPTPSPTAAPTATPTPQPTATPAPTPEPEEDESIVAELVETVIYRVNVGGPELIEHGWLADNFDEDYEAYGVKFEYIPYEPEDEDGEPSVYGPVADFPETNVELLDISDVVNAGP
ncbi:MAG: hypothetical protein FWF03_01455, partial [Defluviitaleaceae bacterium]|nr:hypothetical protein [Defluviitaleaceae bacterium]